MGDKLIGKEFGTWTVSRTYSCRCGDGSLKKRAVLICKCGFKTTILIDSLVDGLKKKCLYCSSEFLRTSGLDYLADKRYQTAKRHEGKEIHGWIVESVNKKEEKNRARLANIKCKICGYSKTTVLRYVLKGQSAKCKACKKRRYEECKLNLK